MSSQLENTQDGDVNRIAIMDYKYGYKSDHGCIHHSNTRWCFRTHWENLLKFSSILKCLYLHYKEDHWDQSNTRVSNPSKSYLKCNSGFCITFRISSDCTLRMNNLSCNTYHLLYKLQISHHHIYHHRTPKYTPDHEYTRYNHTV